MIMARMFQTIGLLTLLTACTPHRVEYRPQSSIETSLGAGLREDVHLEDGTVLRFAEAPNQARKGPTFKGSVAKTHLRAQNEDGTVELSSPKPVDLLHNLMNCLRTREYQLIWDQLIAQSTLDLYKEKDQGVEVFAAVMEERRVDLGRTLTRIQRGLRTNDARMRKAPNGILRIELRPSVAGEYRYTRIDMVQEEQGNFMLIRIQ